MVLLSNPINDIMQTPFLDDAMYTPKLTSNLDDENILLMLNYSSENSYFWEKTPIEVDAWLIDNTFSNNDNISG